MDIAGCLCVMQQELLHPGYECVYEFQSAIELHAHPVLC